MKYFFYIAKIVQFQILYYSLYINIDKYILFMLLFLTIRLKHYKSLIYNI
ncbi:hypothetical protein CBB2_3247 [Clostridium botulinum]|nr:hypothetical protein CBB2_3247 [Clostridium botulinum]